MERMTLQQLKDKLQNLCYEGYSDRIVKIEDFENNKFVNLTGLSHELLNGNEIYIGLFSSEKGEKNGR